MEKVKDFVEDNLHWLLASFVGLLCAIFLLFGTVSPEGYITLDGKDAQISDSTYAWIESAQEALNRIMNEDKPTDEATIAQYAELNATGQGFYTTINDILGRILPDGSSPYQCSRYTAYLATGKSVYSTAHIDYGPVNGKDVAEWLVKNYGFKYIDKPVKGAIGSGGFNTTYGHTVAFMYWTGDNTAMVNDANYVPLAVSTHEMNVNGYVWVVPDNYEPTPDPIPTPSPAPSPDPTPSSPTVSICDKRTLEYGDTLSRIMKECEGYVEYGETMSSYAKTWYDPEMNQTVYDGWHSPSGIGLYAGHVIEKIK